MSVLAPYDRAYRLALRDIQKTVELMGFLEYESHSVNLAVFMASDAIAIELAFFKSTVSYVNQGKGVIRAKDTKTYMDVSRRRKFFRAYNKKAYFNGYLAGFKRGKEVILVHSEKMSYEPSRISIKEIYTKLQKHERSLQEDDYSSLHSLRKRKFVLG